MLLRFAGCHLEQDANINVKADLAAMEAKYAHSEQAFAAYRAEQEVSLSGLVS